MMKRQANKYKWASFILLLFFSNTFILNEVNRAWEVPPILDQNLSHYSAIVVLGGFSHFDTLDNRLSFGHSSDRFLQGLRLVQNGTADQMIISGGSGLMLAPELKESIFVERYLSEIKVDLDKIWIESDSKNTKENALFTAALLKEKKLDQSPILLCTSGYHMRRSIACFEKAGLTVVPYSADFAAGRRDAWLEQLLIPNAYTLAYWNVLIHEWIGYTSYWVMGYV